MSCPALTNKGGKLYISDQPVDCDLTLSELAVLDYVFVPGVGSIGDTGIEQDVVTYPVYGSGLTPQGKGDAVARNWDIEVLDAPSQARDILDEASAIGNDDSYATRIEWPNGDVEFSIVQVASRTAVKGADSGVRVLRYTMVPSFVPIVTNALPVASNVVVSGTYVTGETLTATYDYYSPLGLPESGSTYQWYADGVAIPGADGLAYVIGEEYEGQMISFGVEPSDGLSFGPEARSAAGGPVLFTPEILFDGGIYGGGLWYAKRIINGTQMMYQDSAGTTPVTSDGDPVGLIIDSSGNGNHLIQTVSGSRPTYKTDGTYEWLLPDGIDDFLETAGNVDMKGSVENTAFAAIENPAHTGSAQVFLELSSNYGTNNGVFRLNKGTPNNFSYGSKGTTARAADSAVFDPGYRGVVMGTGRISPNPTCQIWVDGEMEHSTSSAQGTGTFQNYPLFAMARGGASLFTSAPIYALMSIGRNLDDQQVENTTQFFNGLMPKITINVLLALGQSNADGRADIADGPAWISGGLVPDVQAFNGAGLEPYSLNNGGPSGSGRSWVSGGENGKYSFVQVASKLLAEEVSNLVVCQVTQGGTGIYPESNSNGCWNAEYETIPAGTPRLLEAAENRFNSLKQYCEDNRLNLNLVGVLWHQGERDDQYPDPGGYQQRFQAVIDKVREFTDVPDLPFYYGTLSHSSTRYNAVIEAAQLAIASSDANCYCRDNSSLTLLGDNLHFDATSQDTFGTDVFAAIATDLGISP